MTCCICHHPADQDLGPLVRRTKGGSVVHPCCWLLWLQRVLEVRS